MKVRTAKNKGRVFERDCEASLKQCFPNAYMTHEKGYILEYDICDDFSQQVFECKRLKSISWNQLVKFYEKLKAVAPKDYRCYVLFQSNQQPCLAFCVDNVYSRYHITEFYSEFGENFIKHIPVKRIKSDSKIDTKEKAKILVDEKLEEVKKEKINSPIDDYLDADEKGIGDEE